MSKFYEVKVEKPNRTMFEFSELKEKVMLIVNMMLKCGFTGQFPLNQFRGQEPGTDDEIAQFCTQNHAVTFPLMKKSNVNSDNVNEVYKDLKSKKSSWGLTRIKWNFEKYLVDKEGNVVNRWASLTTPDTIDKEVATLL
ncbi:glutathione peroxidase [Ramaria rubella]|nr:glutathione peroxidase [Ramaria rubella]